MQYGFHPSLDDLTLGEYVDLDTYVGDWNNIEKAMNVLYRPIEAKFGVFIAYRYYYQLLKKLKKTPALELKNTSIRVPNYKKIELLSIKA